MTGKRHQTLLIGAGAMGRRWAAAIAETPRVRLACVFDPNAAAARALAEQHRAEAVSNVHDALARRDIDLVVIVTPHAFLAQHAAAALRARKHVLVEKPGSVRSSEMERLGRMARRNRRVLMVGYLYRFFDIIRRAKQLVDGGAVGAIRTMRIRHGFPGRPGYAREWRMDKRLAGGGVLMDQGAHLLDLANWFQGGPWTRVHGALSNRRFKTKVEDTALVTLKNKRGQCAELSVCVAEPKPIFRLEISGSKGNLVAEGLGKKYGGTEVITIGCRRIPCRPDAEAALRREFRHFVAAADRGRPISPNADDASAVLKIVERIYHTS